MTENIALYEKKKDEKHPSLGKTLIGSILITVPSVILYSYTALWITGNL